jgi:hypothetical protein
MPSEEEIQKMMQLVKIDEDPKGALIDHIEEEATRMAEIENQVSEIQSFVEDAVAMKIDGVDGMQGEKGDKGDKGEPSDIAFRLPLYTSYERYILYPESCIDLSGYVETTKFSTFSTSTALYIDNLYSTTTILNNKTNFTNLLISNSST